MPPSTPDERAPDEATSPQDKVKAGARLIDDLILASKFDTAEAVHIAYRELEAEVEAEGFEGRDRFLRALLNDYFKFCGRTKGVDAFIKDVQHVYSNALENNEACLTYVNLFLTHAVTGISRENFDSLVSQMRGSFEFGIPEFYSYDHFRSEVERLKITFPNLAGKQGCDPVIQAELMSAGIELVLGKKSKGEVPSTVTGRLAHYTFERAWHYWIVSGPVPLDVAKKMYADPVGRRDVRARGHSGCPPPESGAKILDKKGMEVVVDPGGAQREDIHNKLKVFSDDLSREARARIRETIRFVDDLSEVPVSQSFVLSYHIDSPEGLKLFADSVRNIARFID